MFMRATRAVAANAVSMLLHGVSMSLRAVLAVVVHATLHA
jgi:hypothetical protein